MLWVGSRYAICIVIILRSAAAVGPRALGSSFCTGLVAIVTVGLFWRNDTVCLALALRTKTFVNLCGKVQQYFYKKNCYSINLHEKKRKLCTSKTIDYNYLPGNVRPKVKQYCVYYKYNNVFLITKFKLFYPYHKCIKLKHIVTKTYNM